MPPLQPLDHPGVAAPAPSAALAAGSAGSVVVSAVAGAGAPPSVSSTAATAAGPATFGDFKLGVAGDPTRALAAFYPFVLSPAALAQVPKEPLSR